MACRALLPGRRGPILRTLGEHMRNTGTRNSEWQEDHFFHSRTPDSHFRTSLLLRRSRLLVLVWRTFGRTDLSKTRKILGFHLRRGPVFTPDRVVHFLAMDADLFWGIDPQTHLVAADVNHGDLDVVADH